MIALVFVLSFSFLLLISLYFLTLLYIFFFVSRYLFFFFFFSSRRRHTRCSRDWSSDVCSSDLGDRAGCQDQPGRAWACLRLCGLPRRRPRHSPALTRHRVGGGRRGLPDRDRPASPQRSDAPVMRSSTP